MSNIGNPDNTLGAFRLNAPPPCTGKRRPRVERGARFLKGPVPWSWLCAASNLPGKALHLGTILWHLSGLTKSQTVHIPRGLLDEMGIDRATAHRARKALEQAGLVSVEAVPGRKAKITILDAPGSIPIQSKPTPSIVIGEPEPGVKFQVDGAAGVPGGMRKADY